MTQVLLLLSTLLQTPAADPFAKASAAFELNRSPAIDAAAIQKRMIHSPLIPKARRPNSMGPM